MKNARQQHRENDLYLFCGNNNTLQVVSLHKYTSYAFSRELMVLALIIALTFGIPSVYIYF